MTEIKEPLANEENKVSDKQAAEAYETIRKYCSEHDVNSKECETCILQDVCDDINNVAAIPQDWKPFTEKIRKVNINLKRTITETKFSGMEEIKEAIRNGEIRPGDQITLTMDGKETLWDVIGKDCEEMVDPKLEHSITIQLHGLIESMPFDTKGNYGSNVWETSEIRAYLNSDKFKNRFTDIVPHLAKVRKENSNGNKTEDMFFLLSKGEYELMTTPYPYYKDIRNRIKFTDIGWSDWHWTRSAHRGGAYGAWGVASSGGVYYYYAGSAYRFSPACVIGA